jgi:hypothetical protein
MRGITEETQLCPMVKIDKEIIRQDMPDAI